MKFFRLALIGLGLLCSSPSYAWWQSIQQIAVNVAVPLSLDAVSASTNTSTGTVLPTLTTTKAPGVIYLVVLTGAAAAPSSVTASGLTFTVRQTVNNSNASTYTYTAPYATNFSGTITVTMPGATFTTVQVVAISGAPLTSFFDTNVSIPGVNLVGVSPAVNTTNANDFIIGVAGGNTAACTANGTWTALGTPGNFLSLEYQIVSATQTALTQSWSGTCSSVSRLIDAIIKAP